MYGEPGHGTLPPAQGYPAPEAPPPGYHQPPAQPSAALHEHLTPTAPAPQSSMPTAGRESRRLQRSTRAFNPVGGQRVNRPRERGRGRTRGAPNYQVREVETLLDLVEEELPIASKGWRVVGARFRDWATVTQGPARTDRSLELKFKQVGSPV